MPAKFRFDQSFIHRVHTLQRLAELDGQRLSQAEIGLSAPLTRCVLVLGSQGANQSLGLVQIARLANQDKAQTSRSVSQLEALGLLKRTNNPEDARAYSFRLSAKGRKVYRSASALAASHNEQLLAPLTLSERAQLAGLLDKVLRLNA